MSSKACSREGSCLPERAPGARRPLGPQGPWLANVDAGGGAAGRTSASPLGELGSTAALPRGGRGSVSLGLSTRLTLAAVASSTSGTCCSAVHGEAPAGGRDASGRGRSRREATAAAAKKTGTEASAAAALAAATAAERRSAELPLGSNCVLLWSPCRLAGQASLLIEGCASTCDDELALGCSSCGTPQAGLQDGGATSERQAKQPAAICANKGAPASVATFAVIRNGDQCSYRKLQIQKT